MPFVRVFEPVVGRSTLSVSPDVDDRSRSAIRPCVISSRVAMGGQSSAAVGDRPAPGVRTTTLQLEEALAAGRAREGVQQLD